MKRSIFLSVCLLATGIVAFAQNTSPYWSLAGNSNAATSSKLGTTNAIALRFLTKNSERMRIDTFGNVGINISSTAVNPFNYLYRVSIYAFFTSKIKSMETTTTTTPQNNVQAVQQGFNDFLQGNISGIIDACTEDVQWGIYKVPNSPFSSIFDGKEGVQEFFSTIAETLDYSSFEPKDYIAQGDNVMVLGHHTATVKNTGKSFDHDFCMHFKLQDGKIAKYFCFIDSYDEYKAFQE